MAATAQMTEMAGTPAMPAVTAKDIVVSFDDAQILNAASLEVITGEIHALIGPNGAGKTTLANVLTGHVRPSSGSVRLFGEELEGATWRRSRKGVGRKFQIPRVFPRLTSEENLMLAASRASSSPSSESQSSLDISDIRSIRGEALSHGWRQRLEMVMVESQGPRVAVLDEPTAGMTRAERGELAEMIVRHRGRVTYLVVEHDMDFVQTVADRVSFMHEGRVTATGTFAEIQANPTVRQIYLGEGGLKDDGQAEAAKQRNIVREPVERLPEARPAPMEDDAGRNGAGVALLVEEFTVYRGPLPAVREVTFEVAVAGSLGILGRNGAGKSTLLGGLTGVLPSRGRVSLHGEDMTHAPAWRRARAGVALVPQGRQLLPNLSVEENLRLAQLEPSGAGPEFDIHELFPAIGGLLKRRAGLLSGGEQQQVAVARALLRRPTVLLLDEPTEGLAPIIIAEITAVLQHLAARGLTLVLAEQHRNIVEALCEHFLVLRSGETAGYARTDAAAIASYYKTL